MAWPLSQPPSLRTANQQLTTLDKNLTIHGVINISQKAWGGLPSKEIVWSEAAWDQPCLQENVNKCATEILITLVIYG